MIPYEHDGSMGRSNDRERKKRGQVTPSLIFCLNQSLVKIVRGIYLGPMDRLEFDR